MGKGLQFLQNKPTHPTNIHNQQKKYEALQNEKQRKLKEKEKKLQLQKEEEEYAVHHMLLQQNMDKKSSKEHEYTLKKHQLSFLYNEPPQFKQQKENKLKQIEKEKKLKALKNNSNNMTKYELNSLEKEIEGNMSIYERNINRFDILKDAPMSGEYVKNMDVIHKPFGKMIRNVKCIKCGQWGHKIYDRECRLNEYDPLQMNANNGVDDDNGLNKKDDPIFDIKQKQSNDSGDNKQYKIKSFEWNDGTNLELIDESGYIIKSEKHKKRKKRKRKYQDNDHSDIHSDIDNKHKRHKKRKTCKRHKRRKRDRNRCKSTSRSRSRSRERYLVCDKK